MLKLLNLIVLNISCIKRLQNGSFVWLVLLIKFTLLGCEIETDNGERLVYFLGLRKVNSKKNIFTKNKLLRNYQQKIITIY